MGSFQIGNRLETSQLNPKNPPLSLSLSVFSHTCQMRRGRGGEKKTERKTELTKRKGNTIDAEGNWKRNKSITKKNKKKREREREGGGVGMGGGGGRGNAADVLLMF